MQVMQPLTRLVAGVAGAVLVVSTFLPWAGLDGGDDPTGWDLNAGVATLCMVTGLIAIAAAASAGRIGLFRPDISMRAAADVFAVATTVVVAVVLLFDLPDDADAGAGGVIALLAAAAVAGVCGDYRVFRGAPLFPRIDAERERR
ncbi:MAG TPA: hypothetical protein VHF58_02405 [Solirubrobacterales bacterium]|nr:hypothetical protein [Solirubrobacterales bacterium]